MIKTGSGARSQMILPGLLIFILLFASMGRIQTQDDLTSYKKKLNAISRQITQIKKSLAEAEQKESSILARLDRIGLQKALTQKEMALNSTRLRQANKDLRTTKNKILELRKKLEKGKEAISKIFVTLYKYGKLHYVELLFQAKSIKNLIIENKNLSILAKSQDNILRDYLKTMDELMAAQKTLEAKNREITLLLAANQNKQKQLSRQERENRAFINKIRQDKKTHTQRLAELSQRRVELQNLLKQLLARQKPLPFVPFPLYEKKGKMDWPIRGKIVSRFGTKRHPKFHTRTFSNGIEIAPDSDLVIKAVHPALVVYASYFRGYGNLIILDHGMKYYTLYGHCADILVKKGDVVNAGQPIAYAGDISSITGRTLYFAIRSRNKFLDPLQWLKRK